MEVKERFELMNSKLLALIQECKDREFNIDKLLTLRYIEDNSPIYAVQVTCNYKVNNKALEKDEWNVVNNLVKETAYMIRDTFKDIKIYPIIYGRCKLVCDDLDEETNIWGTRVDDNNVLVQFTVMIDKKLASNYKNKVLN